MDFYFYVAMFIWAFFVPMAYLLGHINANLDETAKQLKEMDAKSRVIETCKVPPPPPRL